MRGDDRLIIDFPGFDAVRASGVELPAGWQTFIQRCTVRDTGPGQALAGSLGLTAMPGPAWLSALALGMTSGMASDATSGNTSEAVDRGDPARAACWLRFDPVELTPDLTAVWLRGRSAVGPWSGQDSRLVAELTGMVEQAGMDAFFPADQEFGLLRLDAPPDCRFVDLESATGRRLDEVLPTGADAPRWRQWINESQMIFHQFQRLDQPSQAGRGLWFWGSGAVPKRPAGARADRFFLPRQAVVLEGLASWLGAETHSAAEASFADAGPGTAVVQVEQDEHAFDAGLAQIAADWLEPAWRALKRGRLARIDVCSHDRVHSAGRLAPFAFWRRSTGIDAGGGAA